MRLIIGGRGQGKLTYALSKEPCDPDKIADGTCCSLKNIENCRIFNRLHLWIRRELEEGKNPWPVLEMTLEKNKDIIIICDEIGCGIVPITPMEREWRETTGRICCEIASRSCQVERIFCGCVQVIKGERI